MLYCWFSLTLAYNNSSSHLLWSNHSASCILLDTLILIDCRVVASTLSEDGSTLLYCEEQGKVGYHW